MVTYELRAGGPIVFTVQVEGFGPVLITSRKPQIFNGRLTVAPVLKAALRMVEAFAEQNKAELAAHYEAIAQQDTPKEFANPPVAAEKVA
ncbi:MAG TPA: hypothetical protein VGL13_07935 [Polyangiaceae bacterium]|jgi:hypothetical protein